MLHDDLLELAEQLASFGPGRPKQSALRRATSTAYYALFHALCFLAADSLVGWKQPWETITPIYRLIDHKAAKDRLQQLRGRLSPEVDAIGIAFASLYSRRTTADYNPEPFPFGRQETIELIFQARESVRSLQALPRDQRRRLAVELISRARPS